LKYALTLLLSAVVTLAAQSRVGVRPAAHSFKLKDGEEISAVLLKDHADAVVIAVAGGMPRRLPKREIASMTASAGSLMPPGFDQALGSQGLKDLLTFLMLPPPAQPLTSTP
jgi:putative heme-binding domain-containing protein